ncbi:DoxX family protein [Actinokineospora xionganensis]|uniref:DoxX family protein n=1 Tax=Actinokineospora xionganensis TaxID=2684470 RepID=A0ABR7L0L8_9PSEU|nr:DoxX family protein [Actinokineospora xionganensis]MBC6446142.1 DoxX family protein [Actinokineospora xionganensis]
MSTPYVVVTLVAAAMAAFSAVASFLNLGFAVASLVAYGVPRSWWPWLGVAKAAGAVGLAVGLFVPVVGVLAAAGLVLYFAGAVITVVRARRYAHVPFPLLYLAPAAGSLVLV